MFPKIAGVSYGLDDDFATTVTAFSALVESFSRMGWGFVTDKIGYRNCILATGICSMIAMALVDPLVVNASDSRLIKCPLKVVLEINLTF